MSMTRGCFNCGGCAWSSFAKSTFPSLVAICRCGRVPLTLERTSPAASLFHPLRAFALFLHVLLPLVLITLFLTYPLMPNHISYRPPATVDYCPSKHYSP